MSVLDDQIAQQELRVAEVEQLLIERGISRASTPVLINGARSAVNNARQRLDTLLARKAAREEAIEAHEQATRDHADDLVMLGQELDEQRRALGDRVSEAIAALGAAFDAAQG